MQPLEPDARPTKCAHQAVQAAVGAVQVVLEAPVAVQDDREPPVARRIGPEATQGPLENGASTGNHLGMHACRHPTTPKNQHFCGPIAPVARGIGPEVHGAGQDVHVLRVPVQVGIQNVLRACSRRSRPGPQPLRLKNSCRHV